MRFISTAKGYNKKKSHGMLCSLNRTINEYAGASSAHGVKYIYEPDLYHCIFHLGRQNLRSMRKKDDLHLDIFLSLGM